MYSQSGGRRGVKERKMEEKRVHKEIQKRRGVYLEEEEGAEAVTQCGLCVLAC